VILYGSIKCICSILCKPLLKHGINKSFLHLPKAVTRGCPEKSAKKERQWTPKGVLIKPTWISQSTHLSYVRLHSVDWNVPSLNSLRRTHIIWCSLLTFSLLACVLLHKWRQVPHYICWILLHLKIGLLHGIFKT
jgi:hypothetical protein